VATREKQMPRQIDDDEYNFLQQRRQVADFVESIYNDPALTREAKALIKKKYPNLSIPDEDLRNEMEARFEKERKEREEAELKSKRQQEDEDYKKRRNKTQKDYGFTEEAMADLEKLMVEKNVGDYDVAATYFAAKNPKTSEPTFDSSRWHHERQSNFEEIARDPEAWGRTEIEKAIRADEQRNRNSY
jgi:hypothetical protein